MASYHRALIGYGDLADIRQGAYVWNPFRVAPFVEADLEAFRGTDAKDLDATASRLAQGDRPWGLWEGDVLVAYGWTSTRPTAYSDKFTIAPRPGEAYFFDYYTHPDHRGRGCYPLLLAGIANVLAAEGLRAGWIAVGDWNEPSWRGVRKAGFRHAADVHLVRRRLGLVVRHGEVPAAPVRLRARGLLVGRAA